MPNPEKGKAKRTVQKNRKFVEGQKKKIKREGEKIPRKLEHRRKINNFEAVDRIAKARRGRVHETGAQKQGTSVKGQYFRTGLAREEILGMKTPTISTKPTNPERKNQQVEKHQLKTTVKRPVGRPPTRANKTKNKKLATHLPSAKTQRKLARIPIKRKTQPGGSYAEIRNRFELGSGGRNVLENKKPISAHPEDLQLETTRIENNQKDQDQIKPTPDLKAVASEHEIVKNSQEEEEVEREITDLEEKPKKILGVKLIGLGSKAEKTGARPRVTSERQDSTSPTQTLRVNTVTRNKIIKANKTLPFDEDPKLMARRIRKIPGKRLKKHELVLEEIYELPPITVKKKTLKVRYPEKNPEKFAELRKKYRILNGIIAARLSLEKCTKYTVNACSRVFLNIRKMFGAKKDHNLDG